jgi:plasmid stabilization system protein ParE
MIKHIIWSPLSTFDFENILEYLDKKWGKKISNKFIRLTDDLMNQIALNPKQFPLINPKLEVRKCVITKHNTLFYRDTGERIVILRIYDTRQDPAKLKFI